MVIVEGTSKHMLGFIIQRKCYLSLEFCIWLLSLQASMSENIDCLIVFSIYVSLQVVNGDFDSGEQLIERAVESK